MRKGTYFPACLLEVAARGRQAGRVRALITVVADCYLTRISTRRLDKLVKTLGLDSLSTSPVPRMAAELK